MKLGVIQYIDQRTGDGIIEDSAGFKYQFNHPQVFISDYSEGDKVVFSPVYEGNTRYAQQIYSANNAPQTELLRRISKLENEVMRLNDKLAGGFNEYDEGWIKEQVKKETN